MNQDPRLAPTRASARARDGPPGSDRPQDRRMRILVLAPQPFFTLRGTPIAVRLLLEVLAARGHELDVVTFAEGEDVAIEGCSFTRVPRIPGTGGMKPGFSGKKAVADAGLMTIAAAKLARRRYDVIHAVEEGAFIALALKPLFRVPYVYDMDSSIPAQIGDKLRLPTRVLRSIEALEARALRGSAATLTCCRALEEIARAKAPGVPVRTVEDISLLDADDSGAVADDVPAGDPVAMYVGNLESYQGVDLLIHAVARAAATRPDIRLVVVGGNTDDVRAKTALAAELGIAERVTVLGPRPLEQLGAYLRAATVVVSPRLQGVNTPMKVYSYLGSGRPLLATRLHTHTQVLDDRIALLADPTPEAFAAGLVRLFEDAELRDRLASEAAERVRQEFSRDAFAAKVADFYDEVIRRVRPAHSPAPLDA